MSSDIRAALERLVWLNEQRTTSFGWADAFTAARAALAAAPEGEPSDDQLDLVVIAIQALTPHQPDATTHDLHAVDRGREILRQSLARWGRPAAPPAPLEGEVGELVAALRKASDGASAMGWERDSWVIARAATLLSQLSAAAPAVVPIPVSERLPGPNVKVLAHYFNGLGKGRTVCAIWVPAKTRSDSYGDDDFTEYDEETDKFYWPEGWYEQIENWDDLGWVKVYEGEVVYWQPLPKWPAQALPPPAPQGGEVGK